MICAAIFVRCGETVPCKSRKYQYGVFAAIGAGRTGVQLLKACYFLTHAIG